MNEEKWKSSLGPKEQRFLSQALSYARDATVGTISNERLLEAFGPDDIMQGFRDVPQRRADILGACVGTKRNTAVKKSPEEAARDLVLALDSGDTNADDICALIPSDDFVRYHIPARIWALLFHDRWPDRRTPEHARLMVYLVEQVLALSLLGANTSREVVQAIGVEEFDRVPSSLRIRVLRLALDMGEGQTASAKPEPFRAQQLLGVLPPSELVEHLELPVLERVLAVVARRYRWVEDTASATTGGSSPPASA